MASIKISASHRPRVFISYRREDTTQCTHRLYKAFAEVFGKENIFFDLDTIPGGVRFKEYIREQMPRFDVVVIVIGDKWEGPRENGKRRISDRGDFVRIEAAIALELGLKIIPVYVGDTPYLVKRRLPLDLRPLADLNGMRIDHLGRDFDVHANRIIDVIRNQTDRRESSINSRRLVAAIRSGYVSIRRWKPRLWSWPFWGLLSGTAFIVLLPWTKSEGRVFDGEVPAIILSIAFPCAFVVSWLLGQRYPTQLTKWRWLGFLGALVIAFMVGFILMEPLLNLPKELFVWPPTRVDLLRYVALTVPLSSIPALVVAWALRPHRLAWAIPALGSLSGWLAIWLADLVSQPIAVLFEMDWKFASLDVFVLCIVPFMQAGLLSVLALTTYSIERRGMKTPSSLDRASR